MRHDHLSSEEALLRFLNSGELGKRVVFDALGWLIGLLLYLISGVARALYVWSALVTVLGAAFEFLIALLMEQLAKKGVSFSSPFFAQPGGNP